MLCLRPINFSYYKI